MLRGNSVSWKEANTKFNLRRPRAVVEKLREEGHVIYANEIHSVLHTASVHHEGNDHWLV